MYFFIINYIELIYYIVYKAFGPK